MRRNVLSIIAMAGITAFALTACTPADDTEAPADAAAGDSEATEEAQAPVETTTFKVAFNQPEAHPQAQAMIEFGEKLSEATGGAYEIEMFTDELLGSQAETIEQVQTGSVEMAIVGGSLLENFNADFSVLNLPYLYASQEHQMSVLNDESIVGELYDSMIDQNLQVLVAYHGGVRNVYSSVGPVEVPADLDGQKIRVIGSDTNVRMMELMGGVGTPMAQGEVYTAIQSGVLDGAENNELIFADLAHSEIAPFYSRTEHLMMPDMLIINPGVLSEMSEEHQVIFRDLLTASVDTELALFGDAAEASIAKAEAAGATFSDVDLDAFREAVLPLHQERVTNDVTKAIYDQIEAAR